MPAESTDEGYEGRLLQEMEEIFPDYREFLKEYKKKVARLDKYKRKRMSISLAEPTVEALQWFAEHIRDEDGEQIPLSYVIEDALTWIFKDPLVLFAFVTEMYGAEEAEADEGISTEEEPKD